MKRNDDSFPARGGRSGSKILGQRIDDRFVTGPAVAEHLFGGLMAQEAVLLNGSFETVTAPDAPPDGWSVVDGSWGAGAALSNSVAYTGSRSLVFPMVSHATGATLASARFPVRPGVSYPLTGTAKSLDGTAHVAVEWLDRTGASLSIDTMTIACPATGAWATSTGNFIAPDGAVKARVRVSGQGTSDNVWLDSVVFGTDPTGATSSSSPITVQQGSARHGDAVLFSAPFASPPQFIIVGGATQEEGAHWGPTGDGTETQSFDPNYPVYDDFAVLNASTTGGTIRARLRQTKGGTSPATVNAATANNSLTTVGTNAPTSPFTAGKSFDDTYAVHYKCSVTATADAANASTPKECDVTLTVAIDYALDGVTWNALTTKTYTQVTTNTLASAKSTTGNFTENLSVTLSGVTANTLFRIRASALSVQQYDVNTGNPISGGSGSFTAHLYSTANGDSTGAVTYSTSTAITQYASKTRNPEDRVYWLAVGASSNVAPSSIECAASYVQRTAQSFPSGTGTETVVNFESKQFDTDNAVTTGAAFKFTCPPGKAGTYVVTSNLTLAGGGGDKDAYLWLVLRKNGNPWMRHSRRGYWETNEEQLEFADILQLAEGDYVHVGFVQATGASISTEAGWSSFSIVRIGNVGDGAPLDSPAFTGTPTAPTPTAGDNSTKLATTAFVAAAVAAGGGGGSSVWDPVDRYTVGYWPLDEQVATDGAADWAREFALGPNGSLPTVTVGGKTGRTFGSASWLFASNASWDAACAAHGEWTIEAWVYPTTAQNNFVLDLVSSTNPQLARLHIDASGYLHAFWGPSSAPYVNLAQAMGTTVPLNAWTYVAARKTLDGAGNTSVDFIVNGAKQDTQTAADVLATFTNQVFYLGKPGGFTGSFAGNMRRVRFSRKARTDAEISDYYTKTA